VNSFLGCDGKNGYYHVSPSFDAGLSNIAMVYPPNCTFGVTTGAHPSTDQTTGAFIYPDSWPSGALWELSLSPIDLASATAFGYPLTQCNVDFTACAPLPP
jgi:hypothetical protein